MKTLSADVEFHEDARLLVWKQRGVLNQAPLKHIRELIGDLGSTSNQPFNRFSDGQVLDAIDLNLDMFLTSLFFGASLTQDGRP
jgi:hypothetical protein